MREVNAIAVYSPDDPWENAIQDAAKAATGDWLPSTPCQLLAKAFVALQCNNDWLNEENLMPARASHLFSPSLISDKQHLVFVTHLLFLRDILENNEINAQLHSPISFMTRPLAHFLFRHCPVHICINSDLLRAANRKVEFVQVGGFVIVPKGNISVEGKGIIQDVHYHGSRDKIDMFLDIKDEVASLQKVAAHAEINEFGEETLYTAEHLRAIRPDDKVWDKSKKLEGKISEIEPFGNICVLYDNGDTECIPKDKFDESFVVLMRGNKSALQS